MKQKRRLSEFLGGTAFLLPSLAGVALFYIIPFIVVIFYSMIDNPLQKNFVFLQNFKMVLANSAFQLAAKNTATFSATAVPLAVILSLGLALLLDMNIPMKSQFRTFFLSPMMVPVASVVLIWQVIFHYNGVLNEILALFDSEIIESIFGTSKVDWFKSDYNQIIVVVLFLWKNLGYNMILFMSALANIPNDLLEVATMEGAGAAYKFFNIKLRYLSPTILFVAILSLINSFKVFREVYLLTGDYPFEGMYMLQHFMNNTFRNIDYQKLSAAAMMMAATMIAIIAVMFIVENHFGKDVEG